MFITAKRHLTTYSFQSLSNTNHLGCIFYLLIIIFRFQSFMAKNKRSEIAVNGDRVSAFIGGKSEPAGTTGRG